MGRPISEPRHSVRARKGVQGSCILLSVYGPEKTSGFFYFVFVHSLVSVVVGGGVGGRARSKFHGVPNPLGGSSGRPGTRSA